MAQATTLVLKDASDTSVNYVPKVIRTGEFALYADTSITKIAGQPSASLSFRETKTARNVSGKLVFPVLDETSGSYDQCIAKFELVMPTKLDASARQEILARLESMVADTIVAKAAVDGETPW